MATITGITKYQSSQDPSPVAIANRKVVALQEKNGVLSVAGETLSDVNGNYTFDINSVSERLVWTVGLDDFGVPWQANLDVIPGDRLRPAGTFAGYVYEVTVAGNTGGTEPTWWTSHGQTDSIGTATAVAKEFAQAEAVGPFYLQPDFILPSDTGYLYTMDDVQGGAVIEDTGSGYNATIESGTTAVPGLFGNARKINGGVDRLRITNGRDLFDLGTSTGFAICFSFRAPAQTGNNSIIACAISSQSKGGFLFFFSGGKLTSSIKNSAGGYPTTEYLELLGANDDNWHHIILALDTAGNALNALYHNGLIIDSFTTNSAWSLDHPDILIGDSLDTFWGTATVEIENLRILPYKPTAQDAYALYLLDTEG